MHPCSISRPSHQAVFIISTLYRLFMLSANTALAQTDFTPPVSSHRSDGFSFLMVLILIVLIAIFSFLVISSVCISNRTFDNTPRISRATVMHSDMADHDDVQLTRRSPGLDRQVLDTFPIMKYIEIMELVLAKEPLECRVCLSEFAHDDTLRLIPGCCHVFHPYCIDAWLKRNVNCPICRSDLTKAAMVATNKPLAPERSTEDKHHQDKKLQPDQKEGSVNQFMLTLPVHLREEFEVSAGHQLSASIAGKPYNVTVVSNSGRLWSFTRKGRHQKIQNKSTGETSRKCRTGSSQNEVAASAAAVLDRV